MQESLAHLLSPDNIHLLVSWLTNILYAGVLLFVGLWVIKIMKKVIGKNLSNTIPDEGMVGFLLKTIDVLLKIVLLVSIASMLGIKTASFIAILGSLGLAIGLALQGSLSNFAGGILILMFKPFKKGDFVTIDGHDGFVTNIDLLYTSVTTRLNRAVVIPNSRITSNTIINHTKEGIVRRRFYLAISYGSDIKKAKQAFYEAVDKTPYILKDPKPFVEVSDLKENSIVFRMFIWVKPEDYFRTKEPAIENIKYAWDSYGIKAPSQNRLLQFDRSFENSGAKERVESYADM